MRYIVADSNAHISASNTAEARERLRTWYQDGFAESSGDCEGLEELARGPAAVGKTEARRMALDELASEVVERLANALASRHGSDFADRHTRRRDLAAALRLHVHPSE